MRPHPQVRTVLAVQGALLATFAVIALATILATGEATASVLGVRMNVAHSLLLLAAALLGMLAVVRRFTARIWVGLQAGAFTLLFVVGTAKSAGPAEWPWLALDRAGNFLHLALAVIAAATGMAMAGPWLTGGRVPGKPASPRARAGDSASQERSTR